MVGEGKDVDVNSARTSSPAPEPTGNPRRTDPGPPLTVGPDRKPMIEVARVFVLPPAIFGDPLCQNSDRC
jgi:hypothetical protein